MDIWALVVMASAAFLMAGWIKGIAGIGLPTAAIAFMTLFTDPRTAIALVMFPMIGSNAWQLWRGGEILRTAQRYWLFSAVLFSGVLATAWLTQDAGDRFLLAALGIVILIFVGVSWRNMVPPLPDRYDRAAQFVFGIFSGVIGGMTAAWGPPMAMYLATRQVDKDEFIRATGFMIFVGSLPLCYAYAQLGFLTGPLSGVSIAMLVPAIAGFSLGEILRRRLTGQGFRNAILIMFVFFGLNLLRRAIWYD
ncbi:sulfite exporter TauE/SafE family protein [uncultured Roseobacter sp.]|uniref:sulfite exporter TauE/SafE family protein n=1 Tax=uncultured Roseobacter sp. TaxID=114847 RepID=UPI00260ED000|nr:sulfite exporter TauE/SafE family protein [uncultured Roseobacter sp.]